MDYKTKYLKYKLKYLNLKKQMAGAEARPTFESIFNEDFFNIYYGLKAKYDKVVLTGSRGILLHLFNSSLEMPLIETNDFDFLISQPRNEISATTELIDGLTKQVFYINGVKFISKQNSPERSMTFISPTLSFDISNVSQKILNQSININGIDVLNVKTLLDIYQEEDFVPPEKQSLYQQKIKILQLLNKSSLDESYDESPVKRSRFADSTPPRDGRRLFDDTTPPRAMRLFDATTPPRTRERFTTPPRGRLFEDTPPRD